MEDNNYKTHMGTTVNKISKYDIATRVKDWLIFPIFLMWGGCFIYDRITSPPKTEPQSTIKINIDFGGMTEEEKLKIRQDAIRFMEEIGKLKQLSIKESMSWEDVPAPPLKD